MSKLLSMRAPAEGMEPWNLRAWAWLRRSLLAAPALLAMAAGGQSIYTPYQIATYAGTATSGAADGPAQTARFDSPMGVAVDGAGNVYVADYVNCTIRKITPGGTVTTLAGTAGIRGAADGIGPAASFQNPLGLAADAAGNLYVADTGNGAVRKITPAAVVTTVISGLGAASPRGIAVDAAGNLYLAEGSSVQRISPTGTAATLASGFAEATGVALDAQGDVFVADYASTSASVRKITPGGAVTTAASGLSYAFGVAVDAVGSLYVSCAGNGGTDLAADSNTIQRISAGGALTVLAGSGGTMGSADGLGTAAQFGDARGIALDGSGDLFVADAGNCAIRQVGPGANVTTFAGPLDANGSLDGLAAAARFWYPSSVATDAFGNCYVVDARNNTIRKISLGGVVTTLAGAPGSSGSADGAGGSARFQFTYDWVYGPAGDVNVIYGGGIACDPGGNLYVADSGNDTIRKVTPTGVVTTFAGTAGKPGDADGVGAAASFDDPMGVAVDSLGNVYVADAGNLAIRKITPVGAVTTLATASYILQEYQYPDAISAPPVIGVAVDRSGTVYLADGTTVRTIGPDGTISVLAGTAGMSGTADGAGTSAAFNGAGQMAFDPAGNLLVVDSNNNAIRRITPAGIVTTVAGLPGANGNSADGTGAAARFFEPRGLSVDSSGTLYVADSGNNEIRTGTPAASPPVILTQPTSASVLSGGSFTLSVTAVGNGTLSYQWYQGGTALAGQTNASYTKADAQVADSGSYMVQVSDAGGSATSSAATVTVTAPASSGGGGGGGAPSGYFLAALFAAACLRVATDQPRRRLLSSAG